MTRAKQPIPSLESNPGIPNNATRTGPAAGAGAKVDLPDRPHTDWLTGLPDRHGIAAEIERLAEIAAADGRNLAFMTIDLDNFRQLNSTNGHEFGDRFLAAVADRLRYVLDADCLVGRLDGNKFAVLLPSLSPSGSRAAIQARDIANHLREALSTRFAVDQQQCRVSCSIGVLVFTGDGGDPYRVLKCAETAMYEAKSGGKNQVKLFEDDMLERVENTAKLAIELRDAIDDAELELKYQPQTDRYCRIIGAEALIRWDHPESGYVPPDRFVPVAEENGLIIPMTEWVLEQALDTLVRWQRHPQLRDLSLSINISAQQFHQEEFLNRLQFFAHHYEIDMSRLVLELTERVFFGDLETVKLIMHGLRKLGIRLSLDDYGTGYSSLSQLRHLKFDELKIDGTFIREVCTNEGDRAIVRTTLAMARALDIKCVAEWVEKEEQLQFLRLEGCDYLQGHLFGRAMPLDELEKLVLGEGSELTVPEDTRALLVG